MLLVLMPAYADICVEVLLRLQSWASGEMVKPKQTVDTITHFQVMLTEARPSHFRNAAFILDSFRRVYTGAEVSHHLADVACCSLNVISAGFRSGLSSLV